MALDPRILVPAIDKFRVRRRFVSAARRSAQAEAVNLGWFS
jgi:hypothetical protein